MPAAVIAPAAFALPALAGVPLSRYRTGGEAAALLAGRTAPVVFVSDGLAGDELAAAAHAIRAAAPAVVEVRAERWDGRTWSPLAAACRGVIAGFGAGGVAAALRFFETEGERGAAPGTR